MMRKDQGVPLLAGVARSGSFDILTTPLRIGEGSNKVFFE